MHHDQSHLNVLFINIIIHFRIMVKEVGYMVIVDVPDLGLQMYWDKGTRVNLQVDQKWKNHVRK